MKIYINVFAQNPFAYKERKHCRVNEVERFSFLLRRSVLNLLFFSIRIFLVVYSLESKAFIEFLFMASAIFCGEVRWFELIEIRLLSASCCTILYFLQVSSSIVRWGHRYEPGDTWFHKQSVRRPWFQRINSTGAESGTRHVKLLSNANWMKFLIGRMCK